MKTKTPVKRTGGILLLLASAGLMSCAGDSLLIEKEQDNIKYTFCLTNEKGKPANTFKEGESFNFFMAVENPKPKRAVIFNVDFLMKGDYTLRIISRENAVDLLNREEVPCSYENKIHPLYGEEESCRVDLTIPCWGEAWGNARYCIATPQRPPWPAGDYQLEFSTVFELFGPSGALELPPLWEKSIPVSIKINFSIE